MENQVKVNIWSDLYSKKVTFNDVTNFDEFKDNVLKLSNNDLYKVFDLLLDGKTIQVSNLDFDKNAFMETIIKEETNHLKDGIFKIITNRNYKVQNEILEDLKNEKEVYLSFGILDYFLDEIMTIKSAPLVFLKIKIEKVNEVYQISNTNHEMVLNNNLIKLLNDEKRIDISYPIENDFSLIEYLSFVSLKVRNHHFEVRNDCYLKAFDLDSFYIYEDYVINKDKMMNHPLVKSISYLNSQFFNFNKPTSDRLNNSLLSLLNVDNDEYNVLKKVNSRENLFISTNSLVNKEHLLSNILYIFLLNNKKVLLTYKGDESLKEILEFINKNKLNDFSLHLSTNKTDKKGLISSLLNQESVKYDVKLLDQNKIDEITDHYYFLKNNFKKTINALRKNNEPINISINNALNEYYSLYNIKLIASPIPNAELLDVSKLENHLKSIESFIETITNLKVNYKKHPFYGFKRLDLKQNDYQDFKKMFIDFASLLENNENIFTKLHEDYTLPYPRSLLEMEQVLLLGDLIPECKNYKVDLFNLSSSEMNKILDDLNLYNTSINDLSKHQISLLSIYGEKIFTLPYEELDKDLSSNKFDEKISKKYAEYFIKNVKLDESILTHLKEELTEYHSLIKKIQVLYNKYSIYKDYYLEGHFQIEKIQNAFDNVNKFTKACEYLNNNNLSFSYINLSNINNIPMLLEDMPKAHVFYDKVIDYTKNIQNYFDENIINLSSLDVEKLKDKIVSASKSFSSINDYLDFYFTYRKLNKQFPQLCDELLKEDNHTKYLPMFMKRYYYDFINIHFKNDGLLKTFNEEKHLSNIEDFSSYDQIRKESITAIINYNISNDLMKHNIKIKTTEQPYLNILQKKDIKCLPLSTLINNAQSLASSIYPIFIIDEEEVSKLLSKSDITFDASIVFPSKYSLTHQLLPSIAKSKQVIVFDYMLSRKSEIETDGDENFINSSMKAFTKINYNSSSYKSFNITANKVDVSLKKYIKKKLIDKSFVISSDVVTDVGVIDLLCKLPSSNKSTAIIIDRLPYSSIESFIETIKDTKEKMSRLNLSYYRIITPFFFLNEEKEFDKLIDFIITNASKEKEKKIIKTSRPLIEILFDEYIKPSSYLPKIINTKTQKEIALDLLRRCGPINVEEISSTLNESSSIINELLLDDKIEIKNRFIFLKNETITFHYVKKDTIERRFDYVSNEEIAMGIRVILTKKSLHIDTMIKLILLSLGLTKMNRDHYLRIKNIIEDLIDDKLIEIKDDYLYKIESSN